MHDLFIKISLEFCFSSFLFRFLFYRKENYVILKTSCFFLYEEEQLCISEKLIEADDDVRRYLNVQCLRDECLTHVCCDFSCNPLFQRVNYGFNAKNGL